MDVIGCCIAGCGCFLLGAACGAKCCEDEDNAPAAVGAIPYSSQNPVVNQPTTMPMPNSEVGWTRLQDQPYPELNSDCPYPSFLPNPFQNPSVALSIPQPTALVSTSTTSEQAQDCPPKYEDAINLRTN